MGPPGPPGPKGDPGEAGKTGSKGRTGLTGAKGTRRKSIILNQKLSKNSLVQNVSFCKLNVEGPGASVTCSNHYQYPESTSFSFL